MTVDSTIFFNEGQRNLLKAFGLFRHMKRWEWASDPSRKSWRTLLNGSGGKIRLASYQPTATVRHACSFCPQCFSDGHYSNSISFFISCHFSALFLPTEIGAIPTYQDNHLEDDRFSPGFLTIGQKYRWVERALRGEHRSDHLVTSFLLLQLRSWLNSHFAM